MTRRFLLLIIAWSAFMATDAQSFTDNLQTKQQGKGKVAVKQSSDIDELVNGKKTKEQIKAEKKAAKEAKRREKEARKAAANKRTAQSSAQYVPAKPAQVIPKLPDVKIASKTTPNMSHITRTKTKLVKRVKIGPDGKPVMRKVRKTVMYNGSKRVNGYRVQVFLGGNTREDKNMAEQTGHKVKASFPDQPVYVHFHSPRWACRVGNFTSKADAYAFLKKVKKAGFKQAIVLECKVMVRNSQIID